MKLRVKDRILLFLCGLVLLSGVAALVLQMFFSKDVLGFAARLLARGEEDWHIKAAVIAAGVLVLLLGLYACTMIIRRQRRNKGFVRQRTEDGDLNISIKTLDSLTQNCIETQQDVKVSSTQIEDGRDGITINLRCVMPSGINIPLVVNNLQRQIKQYVTACSGVDVKEIRVQVDSAEGKAENSDYQVPVPLAAPLAEPLPEGHKSKRMLHQRMFSHQEEQTVILPPPPEEATKHTQPAERAEEPKPAPADEKPAQEEKPQEEPVKAEEKPEEKNEPAAPAEAAPEAPAAKQQADTGAEAEQAAEKGETTEEKTDAGETAAEAEVTAEDEEAALDPNLNLDIDPFEGIDDVPLIELVRSEKEADHGTDGV